MYIGELTPRIPVPGNVYFSKQYWAPPKNADELADAVKYAAGGTLNFEITAPDYVAVEAYTQPDKDRYILHLVNFDAADPRQVNYISVGIQTEGADDIRQAIAYSPDEAQTVDLPIVRTPGGIKVTLPSLEIYSIIALER